MELGVEAVGRCRYQLPDQGGQLGCFVYPDVVDQATQSFVIPVSPPAS